MVHIREVSVTLVLQADPSRFKRFVSITHGHSGEFAEQHVEPGVCELMCQRFQDMDEADCTRSIVTMMMIDYYTPTVARWVVLAVCTARP